MGARTHLIVGELPEMGRDTVELVRKAVAENRRTSVLVDNRSEGNGAGLAVHTLDQFVEAECTGK